MSHRKKPFSHKAKKQQMQEKRIRKRDQDHATADASKHNRSDDENASNSVILTEFSAIKRAHRPEQASYGSGELESIFAKLSPEVIEQRQQQSREPLVRLPPEVLETEFEDLYKADHVIEIPKRPEWTYEDSKATLDAREKEFFEKWIAKVHAEHSAQDLCYFEHNLEVWRQLWRVAEISDIVLFIVDIRHPVLHFPTSLYDYIVKDLQRALVVVFSKVRETVIFQMIQIKRKVQIDLVSPATLTAWEKYFREHFPKISTASFSQYSKETFMNRDVTFADMKERGRKKYKRYKAAVGARDVLNACRDVKLVKGGVKVDWDALIQRTIKETGAEPHSDEEDSEGHSSEEDEPASDAQQRPEHQQEDLLKDANASRITIGLLGHPNVGKSSLINSVMGRKVVSTSRTPGHTKHFQTILLSSEVRLCDCPGLVFPAIIPKSLQILSGMYRISQVQEPYTAVQYLAERIPLEKILSLEPPVNEDPEQDQNFKWSAWNICEAFALQRGFLTARAARPDVYRAANFVLRMCADGKILLSFKPKGFFKQFGSPQESTHDEKEISQQHALAKDVSTDSASDSSPEDDTDDSVGQGAFALLGESND
ncbi:P-loop containing nucleoside triphosphate hydrolase protein [Phlyctochytrium arcticum]|nr:P-loop containing nucleoside triphosphate hydrolase protein [Phlyctochytrium arcticum]